MKYYTFLTVSYQIDENYRDYIPQYTQITKSHSLLLDIIHYQVMVSGTYKYLI